MIEQFAVDGFVVEQQLLDLHLLGSLHDAFDDLFAGHFANGIEPDEVNRQHATGDPRRARQICNGWKADDRIAAVVLDPGSAERIAGLMGWPGARLIQDNILWKPPGATQLGFHRDNDYSHWFSPPEMATCWIALDSTTEAGGTLEFARGSHLWPAPTSLNTPFHAPDDYTGDVERSCPANAEVDIVSVVVPAGGGSFHHGDTWHGSAANCTIVQRRALAIHYARADAKFDLDRLEHGMGKIYGRYCGGNPAMPDAHFPTLHERVS